MLFQNARDETRLHIQQTGKFCCHVEFGACFSGLTSEGRGGPFSSGIILTEGLNFLLLALCLNEGLGIP